MFAAKRRQLTTVWEVEQRRQVESTVAMESTYPTNTLIQKTPSLAILNVEMVMKIYDGKIKSGERKTSVLCNKPAVVF